MVFTQEDFRKIEQWLKQRCVKDTQFVPASVLTGREWVPIIQDNVNKIVSLPYLQDRIKSMIIPDFYNVTDCCGHDLHLKDAIEKVPQSRRKLGLVVTFRNLRGNWTIVQFTGDSLYQWGDLHRWEGLFDAWLINEIYRPDEEDLTGVQDGNQKFIKLKDRAYVPGMFTGKGRKILRMNLVPVTCNCIDDEDHYSNIINQDSFREDNTVYVIRYDFNIEGAVSLPEGCGLHFEGGSLTGGLLNLNGAKVTGTVGSMADYFGSTTVTNWAEGQTQCITGQMKYWNGEEWKAFNE